MDGSNRTAQESHDKHEAQWWEDGPVFSTTLHGSRVLALAPDAEAPRLGGIHIALLTIGSVLAGLCLAIILPASIPPLLGVFGWSAWNLIWWIPLAIGAAVVLVYLIPGTYVTVEDELRQPSVALRAATVVTAAGLALALLVWSWFFELSRDEQMSSFALVARWGSAAAAALTFLFVTLLLIGVRETHGAAKKIIELRAHGRHVVGRIVDLPDPRSWLAGRPQFRVKIRFDDPSGEHTIDAAMSTRSDRVPLRRSSVLVMLGPDGTSHVEPHPEHPITFSRHARAYQEPTGGGGS